MNVTGILDNANSTLVLNNATGSWNLDGGTVSGGVISLADGQGLIATGHPGNRLIGVTLNGDLLLSERNASLRINGLTLNGKARLSGVSAHLTFEETQTFATGAISFEGSDGIQYIAVEGAHTLTIGPTVTISGGRGQIGGLSVSSATNHIVNQGTITANVAGQAITIDVNGSFTNSGTIEAINGASLTANDLSANLGTARVSGTASSLTFKGRWSDSGTISVVDGTLNLGGEFKTSALKLESFTRRGGTVNVTGILDNANSTLVLNNATGSWNLDGGTVSGGVISLADGQGLIATGHPGNRLIGVTLNGDLLLSERNASLRINGLTLNGKARLSGVSAHLTFEETQTFATGAISFEGSDGIQYIAVEGAHTLTIGPTVTISGGRGQIGGLSVSSATNHIVNQGTITANVPGKPITIVLNGTFTNKGELRAVGGAILNVSGLNNNTGMVTVAALSIVKVTGNYLQTAGSTVIQGGVFASTGNFQLQGGSLTGFGTIKADLITSGQVQPGGNGEASILRIEGNYVQNADGSLDVDVGVAQNDRLEVTKTATLAGTLNISLIKEFAPAGGESFPVVMYASHIGAFSQVTGTDAGGGLSLRLDYGDNRLTLTAQWAGAATKPQRLAVGHYLDGVLELFLVGPDRQIYHRWQNGLRGPWRSWAFMKGESDGKSVAVGRYPDGVFELFLIGTDDQIYHRWQNGLRGPWSSWELMDGEGRGKSVAVGQYPDGVLELFLIGTDDQIYHRWQNGLRGPWSSWELMDGEGRGKSVAVGHYPDGILELFLLGTDNQIYHRWQNGLRGPWSPWAALDTETGPRESDYVLLTDVPFQSVDSHPRRYGVMFSPSSSRSRLHIVDSGRRYGVQLLADGSVQYSVDGDLSWRPITPLADLCTGKPLPAFLSHNEKRAGRALDGVRFDMIAVGRGRIIAKEAGTDRLFHMVIDELFRTHRVTGADCNIDVDVGCRDEDPPVPGFYMKLDPEHFIDGSPSLVVPREAQRHYADHPASLRLPVFAELLELGVTDVMLVLQRARTWYLIDARSPLSIVGPEDLRFTDADLKEAFTEDVIKNILKTVKTAAEDVLKFPADVLLRN